MLTGHQLPSQDAMTVAIIEAAVPTLATARSLFDRFQAMVQHRNAEAPSMTKVMQRLSN